MVKIIIACALAIAVVLFNFMYITSLKKQYESGDFAWVVQAKDSVTAYRVISPDILDVVRVDAKYAMGNQISLPGDTISDSGRDYLKNQVQLHIAKTPITEGTLISQANIAENLDDAFSRKIPSGMRAVTFEVNDETGVAGLVRPGDHIDIVGNFQVQAGKTAGGVPIQGLYTQTIMPNVEVLAVGKDAGIGLSEELVKDPLQAQEQFAKPTSLTIACTPEQAQTIIHVRNAGTLSASLMPGPYDPTTAGSTGILKPITDTDVLQTDAVLMLKSQAYNPFMNGGTNR